MAKSKAKRKATLKRWAAQDIKTIRQMVKAGTSGQAIAKKLKRSRAAVYVRASMEGISLRAKRKATKTATKK